MNKIKKRIAILTIISLLAPTIFSLIPGVGALTAKEVFAAEEQAKLTSTKIETGINCSPQYIGIDNYNESAEYTFKSENEKIATVDKIGYIYGITYGKTKINVSESINGVVTKLGTVALSVVEANVDKEFKVGISGYSWVNINYANHDATYTYKTSNSKVVKVDKYGHAFGIKLGSASITVTQKLKGKTKKIGTVKVKVVNTEISGKVLEVPVSKDVNYYVPLVYVNENEKDKVVYKYKSENTKIAKVDKNGGVIGVKLGTTKISVTETYNKKTIKTGSITIKVVSASVDEKTSFDMAINTSASLTGEFNIKFFDYNSYYYATAEDSSIVSFEKVDDVYGSSYCKINAIGIGSTKITVYEDKNNKTTKLGTVTVTVKEYPVTAFNYSEGSLEAKDGIPTLSMDLNVNYSTYYIKDYLNIEPYYTTSLITYSSSDENVVKIDEAGNITTVAAGSATLTATCGIFSVTINVVVNAVPATSFSFDEYSFDTDDSGALTGYYYLDNDYSSDSLNDYLYIEPYNTSDKVVYTSSDEKIIKVDADGIVTPIAKGKATITATCGKLTATLKIEVSNSY